MCGVYLETVKTPPMMAQTEVRNWKKEAFFSEYSTAMG